MPELHDNHNSTTHDSTEPDSDPSRAPTGGETESSDPDSKSTTDANGTDQDFPILGYVVSWFRKTESGRLVMQYHCIPDGYLVIECPEWLEPNDLMNERVTVAHPDWFDPPGDKTFPQAEWSTPGEYLLVDPY